MVFVNELITAEDVKQYGLDEDYHFLSGLWWCLYSTNDQCEHILDYRS